MLFLDVLQKVIRDYAYKPRVAISEDTDQLSRGEILVRNAADIKGHIVSTLEDIYGHTFEIAISDLNPETTILFPDYSPIIGIWEEIEFSMKHPTTFLSIWRHIEDYERFLRELRLSISQKTMTNDMADNFERRLSKFCHDFKANTKADGIPDVLQVPSDDGSSNFFRDIRKLNISGGYFIMINQQTDFKKYFTQFEIHLIGIKNCLYFQIFTVILF